MSSMLAILLALTGILENPPEDFISLLNTERVLTSLKVDQSEKNLIKIIGGSVAEKKYDPTALKAAFEKLRNGNAKERGEAKESIAAEAEKGLSVIKQYVNDSDPEVSETARLIVKKQETRMKMPPVDPDAVKMLVIRRLTELKSKAAIPQLKALSSSKNPDLAREASRAVAILEGGKPQRSKRTEATAKALEMVPENAAYAMALDLTEPEKLLTLTDYLNNSVLKDANMFPIDRMVAEFEKFAPQILAMVGNPQIDAAVLAISSDIGVKRDGEYVGIILHGSYNLEKMKVVLAAEFNPLTHEGLTYYADRWGPTMCPVDKNTFIIAFGSGQGKQIIPFIDKLKKKKIPAKFAGLKDTSRSRLIMMGKMSDEQKKITKQFLQDELRELEDRQDDKDLTVKAMLNTALLFCDMQEFKLTSSAEGDLTITGSFEKNEAAEKMASAVKEADKLIRKVIQQFGGAMIPGTIDLKKPFSTADSKDAKISVKIDSAFTNLGMVFFMGSIPRQANAAEMRAREAQMEAREAQIEAEMRAREAQMEAEQRAVEEAEKAK